MNTRIFFFHNVNWDWISISEITNQKTLNGKSTGLNIMAKFPHYNMEKSCLYPSLNKVFKANFSSRIDVNFSAFSEQCVLQIIIRAI
jgi:ATP-dependent Clp protease ATP-binding subunit ClpA